MPSKEIVQSKKKKKGVPYDRDKPPACGLGVEEQINQGTVLGQINHGDVLGQINQGDLLGQITVEAGPRFSTPLAPLNSVTDAIKSYKSVVGALEQRQQKAKAKHQREEAPTVEEWVRRCEREERKAEAAKVMVCFAAVSDSCSRARCPFFHAAQPQEKKLLAEAAALRVKFPAIEPGWFVELQSRVAKVVALNDSFCLDFIKGACKRERCNNG